MQSRKSSPLPARKRESAAAPQAYTGLPAQQQSKQKVWGHLDPKQNQQGSVAQTYRAAPPCTAGKPACTRPYHPESATSGQAASQQPHIPPTTPESTEAILSRLGERAISSNLEDQTPKVKQSGETEEYALNE